MTRPISNSPAAWRCRWRRSTPRSRWRPRQRALCLAERPPATEKQKMLAGELYDAADPEIQADIEATHRWLARYNATLATDPADRRALLLERLAAVGAGAVIRPP